jgi:hypothetical protein
LSSYVSQQPLQFGFGTTANLYANVAHIGAPAELGRVFGMITDMALKLMGKEHVGMKVGAPADIVIFDSSSAADAVATIAPAIAGWKNGRRTFFRPPPQLFSRETHLLTNRWRRPAPSGHAAGRDNPYDGHTLRAAIDGAQKLTGCEIERAYVDNAPTSTRDTAVTMLQIRAASSSRVRSVCSVSSNASSDAAPRSAT